MRRVVPPVVLAVLWLLPALPSSAGIVHTLDGRTLEGDVKLDPSGKLHVTAGRNGKNAKPVPVDLADVVRAVLREAPAARAPRPPARPDGDSLPPGWSASAIGQGDDRPYARYKDGGTYSVKAAAGSLGAGAADSFVFVHQSLPGDVEVVVRVVDTGGSDRAAAGPMLRAGPEPDAAHAALLVGGGRLALVTRPKKGEPAGAADLARSAPFPAWLRLARRGPDVTAYLSRDGRAWEQVGRALVPLGSSVLAGAAVGNRDARRPEGAHFEALRAGSLTPVAVVPARAALATGLLLRSGTHLRGVDVWRTDGASLKLNKFERENVPVSLNAVARLAFTDLSPEQAARIPERSPGALLRNGDFFEGDIRSVKDGRAVLSSVVFGLKKFDVGGQVLAVAAGPVEPPATPWVVRTTDGSTLMAESIAVDRDRLVVEEPLLGKLRVGLGDVAELAAGAARVEALAGLRPARFDPPAAAPPTGAAAPAGAAAGTAPGAAAPSSAGLAVTAGNAVTWKLPGKFRLLTFDAAVATGVPPSAPLRLVVLADGKEVFRSKPLTSAMPGVPVAVPLAGVAEVTLKVESADGPAPAAFPASGLFAEAALVK